jgi:hypothetical protein
MLNMKTQYSLTFAGKGEGGRAAGYEYGDVHACFPAGVHVCPSPPRTILYIVFMVFDPFGGCGTILFSV